MIVTAWNNSGTGYGLKIAAQDRDLYFDKNWKTIKLMLEGAAKEVEINIDKDSFWGSTCRELIKKEIGEWLKANGNDKWEKGNPPKFNMTHIEENRFYVANTMQDQKNGASSE